MGFLVGLSWFVSFDFVNLMFDQIVVLLDLN